MRRGKERPSWWHHILFCISHEKKARVGGPYEVHHQAVAKLSYIPTSRLLLRRQYDSVTTPVLAISLCLQGERPRANKGAQGLIIAYCNAAASSCDLAACVQGLICDRSNDFSCKLASALRNTTEDDAQATYFHAKLGTCCWAVQATRCSMEDPIPQDGCILTSHLRKPVRRCFGCVGTERPACRPTLLLEFHHLDDHPPNGRRTFGAAAAADHQQSPFLHPVSAMPEASSSIPCSLAVAAAATAATPNHWPVAAVNALPAAVTVFMLDSGVVLFQNAASRALLGSRLAAMPTPCVGAALPAITALMADETARPGATPEGYCAGLSRSHTPNTSSVALGLDHGLLPASQGHPAEPHTVPPEQADEGEVEANVLKLLFSLEPVKLEEMLTAVSVTEGAWQVRVHACLVGFTQSRPLASNLQKLACLHA
ncbi:hypothetical protein VOLCADRAFT_97746 [Volvox carteri f. nagariensis]|uniref:Uncharacterized protein n=1 Tax=Volvox carteri f. nagariensis TaxID=3068 RepID=D8UDJ1_VOLCA|nr:uncharacterized protein VOLCADRAFT_97746 [Volvox carteri f. nagariensis]EFJ42200.1 hypothetical protein VOLCADRAFT_97746 [Volvox carteri f. nagariensis]|eukprot:XP_002956743.1 hypothetical protein VOLCADRAFT_97746 [Volvox carteri f. nagariensis]